MKRRSMRIVGLFLLGPLLAACSFGGEPQVQRSPQPAATTRPVTTDGDTPIEGRLLFVQDGNLYLYQGQTTQQITNDGTARDPAWSPDSSRIAFVRREESFSDIYLLSATGGLPTQVSFNGSRQQPRSLGFIHEVVWAAEPTWAPDGTQLAFLSQLRPPTTGAEQPPVYEFPLSVYRYELSLVGQRQPTNDDLLIRSDEADLQHPAWAPDDSGIAYVRVPRANEPRQIVFFDLATGNNAAYPGIPENAYDPAWSTDGQWLAFAAVVDGQTDLWAIPHPRRGGNAVRLTSSGNARAPAWSPTGNQLAFVQVGDNGTDVHVAPLQRQNGTLTAGKSVPLTSKGHIDANSGLSWGK